MPIQSELFDQAEAYSLKESGIHQALQPVQRKQMLYLAQTVAKELARQRGTVDADAVVEWFLKHRGIRIDRILGNAMGALFRDKDFVPTGEWVPSRRPSRRANHNRVWKLKKRNI
jgi:hypothetical protein